MSNIITNQQKLVEHLHHGLDHDERLLGSLREDRRVHQHPHRVPDQFTQFWRFFLTTIIVDFWAVAVFFG